MTDRYFNNPFESFESYTARQPFHVEYFSHEILKAAQRLLDHFEAEAFLNTDARDGSVYTGSTGIALLYMRLADAGLSVESVPAGSGNEIRRQAALAKARNILTSQSISNKRHKFTFLCGDVGPIATRIVLNHLLGDSSQAVIQDLELLQSYAAGCVALETGVPDELLYGRAGFLYSLLFVEKHMGRSRIDPKLIGSLARSIIESGEQLSSSLRDRLPHCPALMYQWHDSYYLGAAHGLAGIFCMLLEVREHLSTEALEKIRLTIDFLIGLRYPSGNYPSSLGSQSDRLVHWCHGAPGFVHMFASAYEVFNHDKRYLAEARSCAEVIWEKGLLRKGYGICHGVAGNGYAFLRMYRLTGEQRYLYWACRFAEFCCAYGTHGCRIADRPYSLFEGLAGTIYFLVEMLSPDTARFPAFEL